MGSRAWPSCWSGSRASSLKDPTDPNHGFDLKAMATDSPNNTRRRKAQSKEYGSDGPRALPGVHHPVFRGKPVNYDPREHFIAEFMAKRGDYNVFHAYYRELVQALYATGASRYVFCVNVDAVIAAMLLAVLWKRLHGGRAHREESGDGGVQCLPVWPNDRRGGGDRRPSQPRPQHGYANAPGSVRICGVTPGRAHNPESRKASRVRAAAGPREGTSTDPFAHQRKLIPAQPTGRQRMAPYTHFAAGSGDNGAIETTLSG